MAKATIILHSGDLDKVYSALIIGNGVLSMGMECSIYFTFWGLERLKKGKLSGGGLSKMNMLGLGRLFMKRRMKGANVASLERLIKDFKELGGKIIACEMTMEVMGCRLGDFEPGLVDECGAVGTYIKEARESDINLFI
ncbi:MAG: DsrE/DsrF/DrsH-like family protein [Candidatus Altiarchaeota archaeon]|nr:DsrE/DsrF/DrsH-like family protein [Candidatus Altiarchaeota archaeon]